MNARCARLPAGIVPRAATPAFLRRYAPFDRMRDEALRGWCRSLAMRAFREGRDDPLGADGSGRALYIVERGLVGRRPDDTHAEPDRTLGPGEFFPVGALSAGGTTTKIFHALEDTVCFLLPRDEFLALRGVAGVRALLHAGDHRDAAGNRSKACTANTASVRRSSRR